MSKKNRAGIFLLLLLAGLLIFTSVVCAEGANKKNTVMIYMCGSDLEMKNSQATRTINEILSSRFNRDETNVVLLLGGSRSWATGYDPNVLTILDITGRRPKTVGTLPLANMGDTETLRDFLTFSYENYPAENFSLVIWDHGGGPIYGVCLDRIFSDMMNIKELKQALDESPFAEKKLGMIVFNACLMASAEVAHVVAPYAGYMVATEDSMYGLSYEWLAGMENDETILDTAKRIVDLSYEYNAVIIKNQFAKEINAVSVIDLSAVDQVIGAMDVFFGALTGDMNETTFVAMSSARRDSMAFGIGESGDVQSFDLVDLGDITRKYSGRNPEGAMGVDEAVQNAVVYSRVAMDGCSGLTVYHPYLNKFDMKSRISIYNDLDFSEGYKKFVQTFASVLTQTPFASWAGLHTDVPDAVKDQRTLFTLTLNDEQKEHFGDADLEVLRAHEDGSYTFAYMTPFAEMNEKGSLTGEFNGTALYVTDSFGDPLSFELEFTRIDNDTVMIPAEMVLHATETREESVQPARIICKQDLATKKLTPGAVSLLDDFSHTYTTAYNIPFEEFDEIILTSVFRREQADEDGTLPSFENWEEVDRREYRKVIDDSWEFRLLNDTIDTTELFASFRVRDSQNNTYSSIPRVIKSGNVPIPDELLVSYDDLKLVLINQFNCYAADGNLVIGGSLTNLSENEAIVLMNNFTVNGNETDMELEIVGLGENWGLMPNEIQNFYLNYPAASLTGDTVLTDMTFDMELIDPVTEETLGVVPVEVSANISLAE